MPDLLFEIGTEEIPAFFLAKALADLRGLATEAFKAARLEHGDITVGGTPRRIALHVSNLPERQPDVTETVTGPPVKAAYAADGTPTRAATSFAEKNGVTLDAISQVEVAGKGMYLAIQKEHKGDFTRLLLPQMLVDLAHSIAWKKSMRWASLDDAFVRPVHWVVALFANQLVPLKMYGVESGDETRGHRFMAPAPIRLDGTWEQYRSALEAAFVVVDPADRRSRIESELRRIESAEGIRVRPDAELLDEVTNLVEYPVAVCGRFAERYLEVPPEVVISAMRAHQRYFATETPDGKLANRFVTIANTRVKDKSVTRAGNERVLAARLADADFFFREDQEKPLSQTAEGLEGVVFQAKLGSVADKVRRITARCEAMASATGVPLDKLTRAAQLCKADLLTRMVGEFPDLQGLMGRHYARLNGEDAEVAEAIFEHYLPRGAADSLPSGDVGAALGILDRMDTIVGCFSAGLLPSGSADPFGLRRAALAVLNILLQKSWRIRLDWLVDGAGAQLQGKVTMTEEARGQVLTFLRTRFKGLLSEGRGLAADCVEAAMAAGFEDVPDTLARATAVARLRERDDFEPLGVAFKRVANILKGQEAKSEPATHQFQHPSESALWEAFSTTRQKVDAYVADRSYDGAVTELASLKPVVDKFFDDVLVMDENPDVRTNRLALLGTINATFLKIADFRQLAVK